MKYQLVDIGCHDVEFVTIKEKVLPYDKDGPSFKILQIFVKGKKEEEYIDLLKINLFMNGMGLEVRKISDSLVERVVQVKR